MKWKDWHPIYEDILMDFQYSREDDERAAILLSCHISGRMRNDTEIPLKVMEDLIGGKQVIVTGSALRQPIPKLPDDIILLATGTSIRLFLEGDIVPDIIVTDLDGDIEAQIEANKKGSLAVIHAHGDNILDIEAYMPRFTGKVMGTTQAKPLNNVHNFGGFTDGDRAVLMAEHFGAGEIVLLGFDLDNPVPKAGTDIGIKKRKLKWAKRLVGEVKTPILFN